MTIKTLEYIFENNIQFINFYKISGRYWLNDNFNYNLYNNNLGIFKKTGGSDDAVCTIFYKLTYENLTNLHKFLCNHIDEMKQCIGYEVLFNHFIKTIDVTFIENIGVEGYVFVCGSFIKQ